MTEKIIIDGVNVAGCCCFENNRCLWTKRYYENQNVAPPCEAVKNCYYKQLKRLEQENKELKEKVKELDKMTGIFSARLCGKYRSALEEIREIAEPIYEQIPDDRVLRQILLKINEVLE